MGIKARRSAKMRTQRTLFGIGAVLAASIATAQSDGGMFDAAVVLTPGMALQRGAVIVTGGYQNGLLRHGDVIRTDDMSFGPHHILTSDGTVIGMGSDTTIVIDGRRIGFDVFRVMNGSANILGNVNMGYPMPFEFRRLLPFRAGSVTVFPNPDPFAEPIITFPRSFNPIRRLNE
jgi:hypothetical protein